MIFQRCKEFLKTLSHKLCENALTSTFNFARPLFRLSKDKKKKIFVSLLLFQRILKYFTFTCLAYDIQDYTGK